MSQLTTENTSQSTKRKRDRESASPPPALERTIKKGKVASPLSTLPPELFNKISEYLPAAEVLGLASTAQLFLKFGPPAEDRKKEDQRKAEDVMVSVEPGSYKQLQALIKNHKLTILQAKILRPADKKTTPLQKHLQRTTYAEILSGKISLDQALEQIRHLEFSLVAKENLPLMKVWASGLAPWQKKTLDGGLPWLSLIYYPDPTVDGFFTPQEMSGDGYMPLHAEIARSLSLTEGNPYSLPVSWDNLKTSSVEALVAAFSTSISRFGQLHCFCSALTRNSPAIAQVVLAADPGLLQRLTAEEYETLVLNIKNAIACNAIAVVRWILSLLTVAQRQDLFLSQAPHSPNALLVAVGQGHTQMACILLAALNADQRQTMLLAPQQAEDSFYWFRGVNAAFFAAVIHRRVETAETLLTLLNPAQRQKAILAPQGPGEYAGQSALSVAETSGHTAMLAMMKDYLPAPEIETEVALTADSGQPSSVGFFAGPAASVSGQGTEPQTLGGLAQHR